MNRKFLIWENPKQAILTLMLVLMCVGCINVFSASFVAAEDMFGNGFYYLFRYLIFGVTGFGLMLFVSRMDYRILLNKKLVNAFFIVVAGMLILVDVIGVTNKGAARWLYLGPVSIQPSEFAKLAVIMFTARYLGRMMRYKQRISLISGDGVLAALQTVFYCLLVYKQPDLGTAAIIFALMMCIFIIAGINMRQVMAIVGTAVAGAVALTIAAPYRMDRIKVWFDPWLDPRGDGYQMVQSLMAIGSGSLTGTNWGQGTGKFFYLPEAHTDFAFAIFCQENGLIGAALLILVFVILGCAFFRIAARVKEERGFLLVSGVSFLVIGQAAANMAMVCGLFPVIGVPLVFISYGGTSMVVSMIAIGLALSVYNVEARREAIEAEEGGLPHEERRGNLRFVDKGRWQR